MIELQGVTKELSRGAERLKVLDSVDLEISEGSYVAIAGRSGSGKSTLLSIVGCVDTPTQGHYRLAGNDISGLPDAGLSRLRARHFGFIFQSFHLLPELTAEENVMAPMRYGPFPKAAWRGRARELLAQVGLQDRAEHKPYELSGGEQQRIAIARALANDPEVLLADEPTGNLDVTTRDSIVELLEAQHERGKTLVLVTHDAQLERRARTRYRLEDGRIARL